MPPVLIISGEETTCDELLDALPASVPVRSVGCASDTEGIGARLVVIGGAFPLAELLEVRAHPQLFDKPVVLFAPRKELPSMDWRALDVWPVVSGHDPIAELVDCVRHLLAVAAPSRGDKDSAPQAVLHR
jgi:hypothetical protein